MFCKCIFTGWRETSPSDKNEIVIIYPCVIINSKFANKYSKLEIQESNLPANVKNDPLIRETDLQN